jgi:hypothetical protein
MFKIIFQSLLFFVSFSAFAVDDSNVETTKLYSGDALVSDNFNKINNLEVNYNAIESNLSKFKTCEAKNKIYLGLGVAGADSDDCVDVQSIPVKLKSQKPSFAGFKTDDRMGQLVIESSSYNTADTSQSWGRPRADQLCRTDFTNSRALTVDDLKYMQNEIPLSTDHFNHTSNLKYIWLFDGDESVDENEKLIAKYPFNKDAANCQAWKSGSSAVNGLVLEVTGTPTNYYMQQNVRACDLSAILACVYN